MSGWLQAALTGTAAVVAAFIGYAGGRYATNAGRRNALEADETKRLEIDVRRREDETKRLEIEQRDIEAACQMAVSMRPQESAVGVRILKKLKSRKLLDDRHRIKVAATLAVVTKPVIEQLVVECPRDDCGQPLLTRRSGNEAGHQGDVHE